VVAAVAVAVVLVLLLAGGDDDKPTSSRPSAIHTSTTTATTPTRTVTAPPRRRRPSNRDAAAIQRVVTRLVQANEQGDGATVCRLLGKPAAGTGIGAADRCARSAGVDLSLLPTSDELSVGGIHVSGDRATASPSPGTTVSLRRSGGRWTVTGMRR
jgi:hypothetical protein